MYPTAQPSPYPTATTSSTPYPQPAPAPTTGTVQGASTGTDWNTQWNQIWNDAWNAGYNSGTVPNVDVSFNSAVNQGYSAGQAARNSQSSGGGSPTAPQAPSAPAPDYNAQLLAEIDNIYNQTMNIAGQREQTARANEASTIGDVENQFGASQKSLEASRGQGEREIASSEVTAGQTKENALTAGRRLYGELQMGGQQRFGGASSAGQAYSELTGREFQRGQAQTQQSYQNAMTKIMEMKQTLQERYDSAIYNLTAQKDTAINDVRRMFREKLDQIDQIRSEAGINKSTQRLDLLQNLRNQVYQINLAAVQTQTALTQQLQQAQSEQDKYVQMLSGNTQQLGQNQQVLASRAPSNPTTSLAMSSGGMGQTQEYTGRIKRDELTGIASPRRDDLFA